MRPNDQPREWFYLLSSSLNAVRTASGALMVKKDLERVGIPYRDELNRVADFHAAGRHTHITELLRNDALTCPP